MVDEADAIGRAANATARTAHDECAATGVGESGVGGTLGSLCSAIENALPEADLHLSELPLTPSRIWQAIQDAPARVPAAA